MTQMDGTQRLTRIYTIDLPKGRTPVAGRVLVQVESGDVMFFSADRRVVERALVPPDLMGVVREWIAASDGAADVPPMPESVRLFLSVTFGLRPDQAPPPAGPGFEGAAEGRGAVMIA